MTRLTSPYASAFTAPRTARRGRSTSASNQSATSWSSVGSASSTVRRTCSGTTGARVSTSSTVVAATSTYTPADSGRSEPSPAGPSSRTSVSCSRRAPAWSASAIQPSAACSKGAILTGSLSRVRSTIAAHAVASSLVSPAAWRLSPREGARRRPVGSTSMTVDAGRGEARDTKAVPIREVGE